MRQLSLFAIEPTFTNRSVKSVTFQGKLDLPIHRWYRLTPSFSPHLAHDIAEYFKLSSADLVLDPFSGVGTVPLCMKYLGIPAVSVEINPYLYFVSTVKTRTYRDLSAIDACFTRFVGEYRRAQAELPDDKRANRYLQENERYVPRIHKPKRWWSPPNLMQLVCLRRLILNYPAATQHHDLLKMAVLGILVPTSNAKHNHVSLTFADAPQPRIDIADVLQAKTQDMMMDLRRVARSPCAEVGVHRGNSKHLSIVLAGSCKASAVITSPPYPNRFSYARETRPHLFFFDFINNAKAVGELETDAIGGTWGKATSVLSGGVAPKNYFIERLLSPHLKHIPHSGNLMANYVTKYFNDMHDHIAELCEVCTPKCQLAYVLGNSKFYGNPLPTEEILARIFEHFGFAVDRIDRMRKRQSKSGLYEAVTFIHRGGLPKREGRGTANR